MYPNIGKGCLCSLFGKTRQAWYDSCKRQGEQQLSDAIVIRLCREIREQMPRLGVRKLHHLLSEQLKEHHISIGRDRLYELLRHHGMLLRYRRRKPFTTNSRHPFRYYPNLISDLLLTSAGQLWVSDITYLRLSSGFSYLFLITDAYSRKIIGWALGENLSSQAALDALESAQKGKKSRNLIHHSDRGVQYCCTDYVRALTKSKISISMSRKGDPYENAIAERVNGILKSEFDLGSTFNTHQQALEATSQAIEVYNNKRPHASCDYLTPRMAHQANGVLKKRWKHYPYSGLKQNKEYANASTTNP